MYIIKNLKDLYEKIKYLKKTDKKIGLVPTMGNLHNGHIQLILLSKKYVDITIVSIFINPIQFNNVLDFKNYPKSFEEDCKILKNNKIDILFFPDIHEMYSNNLKNQTFIKVPKLSDIIEGQYRPGHFQGVTTIIAKLFNITQPDFSFFGEKDYQQLLIIKTLVAELNYAIKIISLPIVRSKNGLALSSRNNNLNSKQTKIAPYLYKIIKQTSTKIIQKGNINSIEEIIQESKILLLKKGFSIDIFNVYHYKTLNIPDKTTKKMILLASVSLGRTRLIDNKKIFFN
ncbi:pantoate--beta-alanine ligase [Buchnera aphidicola (Brachycaudus cardui)]|uniref:Pantothenate synthetase n=1 Tax=Buchnera aphidicola (Brachycaudus cardui) TaxID=557993 RepID=A0A4D6Y7V1_9GAMM|nr:pantoate--beta-alanine ligase [Buchnera aphidicola]QCI20345.1 pantoate--beta-alanine ligase [Buchnera aphidicola (Brachycaudus cardui)]